MLNIERSEKMEGYDILLDGVRNNFLGVNKSSEYYRETLKNIIEFDQQLDEALCIDFFFRYRVLLNRWIVTYLGYDLFQEMFMDVLKYDPLVSERETILRITTWIVSNILALSVNGKI